MARRPGRAAEPRAGSFRELVDQARTAGDWVTTSLADVSAYRIIFGLEPLEQRVLLSGDLLIDMSADGDDMMTIGSAIIVTFNDLGDTDPANGMVEILRAGDNSVAVSVFFSAACDSIQITGTTGDDSVTIDASFIDAGEVRAPVLFDGAGGTADSLTGGDADNDWQIVATAPGTLTGDITTLAVEALNGGSGADTYTVIDAGSTAPISIIDSGGASDVLVGPNADSQWTVSAANAGSLADSTGATTLVNFTGIDTLTGGGGDNVLVGPDADSQWTVNGADAGTLVDSTGMTTLVSFTGIENLTGGANVDTFTVTTLGSLSGTLAGGGGSDVLVGPDADSQWTVNAANAGTLADSTGATTLVSFTGVENLTGGANVDTFTVTTLGSLSGTLAGGGGSDVLVGPDADSQWTVNAANAGTLADSTGATTLVSFTGVENLTGGANVDTFTVTTLGSLSGTLAGGGGSDVLVGPDADSQWTVNAANAGTLADSTGMTTLVSFTGIENLTGSSGADTFDVTSTGSLDGTLASGAGDDTITVAMSGVPAGTTLTIDGGDHANLDQLFVTGTGAFDVTPTSVVQNTSTVSFSAIEEVTVGDAASTVTIDAMGEDIEVRPGEVIVHRMNGTQTALKTTGTIVLVEPVTLINDLTGLLDTGLTGLAALGKRIEGQGALGEIIPTLSDNTVTIAPGGDAITGGEVSLGRAMGVGQVFDELRRQIDDQITNQANNTVDELRDALAALDLTGLAATLPEVAGDLVLGDLSLKIDSLARTVAFTGNVPTITYVLSLSAARTTAFDLDLGDDADSLGLTFDPNTARDIVDLNTAMSMSFEFGVTGTNTEDFFVSLSSLSVNGDALERDLNFQADFGFLGGQVVAPSGDNVMVTRTATGVGFDYTVEFVNDLATTDVPDVTLGTNSLTGGGATVTATKITDGSDVLNEQYTISVDATGGSYTLIVNGRETAPIAFDAMESDVTAALMALPDVGVDQVAVHSGPVDATFDSSIVLDENTVAGADLSTLITTGPAGGGSDYFLSRFRFVADSGVSTTQTGVLDDLAFRVVTDQDRLFNVIPRFEIIDGDPNDNINVLNDFAAVLPGDVTEMLGGLQRTLRDLADGPLFAFDIPFADRFDDNITVTIDSTDRLSQKINVAGNDGAFTLVFGAETTRVIPATATGDQVRDAIALLTNVGSGNVSVTRTDIADDQREYTVTFQSTLGANTTPLTLGHEVRIETLGDVYDLDGAFGRDVLQRQLPGSVAINATTPTAQTVTVTGVGGSYTFTFGSATTPRLSATATAADIQTALEGLTGVSSGDVSVSVSETAFDQRVYTINFQGALSGNTTALTAGDITVVTGLTVPLGGEVSTQISGFANAQDLGAILTDVLGVTVTPTYDASAQSLTYRLQWTHDLALPQLAIDLGLDLDVLEDAVSSDLLDTGGNTLTFDLSFGIDLAARAPFTLAPPLPVNDGAGIEAPADGKLTSDLTFDVILNNDDNLTFTVTVPVADTTTNTGPADLRDDIENRIDEALLSGSAQALGFNYFDGSATPTSSITADRLFDDSLFTGNVVFALSVNGDSPTPVFMPIDLIPTTFTGIDAAVDKINQAIALTSVTFDGTGDTDTTISLADNKFSNPRFAVFADGDEVVYRNGGGTSIEGLVDGESYFVFRVTSDGDTTSDVRLAVSRSVALLGDGQFSVDLTALGSGTGHSLRAPNSLAGIVEAGKDGAGTRLTFSEASGSATAIDTLTFNRVDGGFSDGNIQADVTPDNTRVTVSSGVGWVTAVQLRQGAENEGVPADGVLTTDAVFTLFIDDVAYDVTLPTADTAANATRLAALTGQTIPAVAPGGDIFFELETVDTSGTSQTYQVLVPVYDGNELGFDGTETGTDSVTATNAVLPANVVLAGDVTLGVTVDGQNLLVLVPASSTDDNLTAVGPKLGLADTVTPATTLTGLGTLYTPNANPSSTASEILFEPITQDVTFDLTVDDGSTATTHTVTLAPGGVIADIDALVTGLQAAIDAQFGANVVTVAKLDGNLTLTANDGTSTLSFTAISERLDLLVADINVALGLTAMASGLNLTASLSGSNIVLTAPAGTTSMAVTSPGRTLGNASLTDLLSDIQSGLATAVAVGNPSALSLNTLVGASLTGSASDQLTLDALSGSNIVTLRVSNTDIDPATQRNAFGFADGQTDSRINGLAEDLQGALDQAVFGAALGFTASTTPAATLTAGSGPAVSAQDALFALTVADASSPNVGTTVLVRLAAGDTSADPNVVITPLETAINTALSNAGIVETVTVSNISGNLSLTISGSKVMSLAGPVGAVVVSPSGTGAAGDQVRIGFSPLQGTGISALRLQADLELSPGVDNATVSELRFRAATQKDPITGLQVSLDPQEATRGRVDLLARTRSDVFFLDSSSIDATFSAANPTIEGSGRIGFLGVDLTGAIGRGRQCAHRLRRPGHGRDQGRQHDARWIGSPNRWN